VGDQLHRQWGVHRGRLAGVQVAEPLDGGVEPGPNLVHRGLHPPLRPAYFLTRAKNAAVSLTLWYPVYRATSLPAASNRMPVGEPFPWSFPVRSVRASPSTTTHAPPAAASATSLA